MPTKLTAPQIPHASLPSRQAGVWGNRKLPQTAYRKLVSDISNIFEQARKKARQEIDRIAIRARWAIGRRIVREEQSGELRAEYGAGLIKNLSRDLTKKYGSGFSKTELGYMREFYIAYTKWPISPAPEKLTWEHYRNLLAVNEKEQRDFLSTQAIRNHWSTRELSNAIKKYKQSIKTVPQKVERSVVAARGGRLNAYKVISPGYVKAKKGNVFIDCGFQISLEVPLGSLKNPETGEIVTVTEGKSGFSLKRTQLKADSLYTYVALVDDVIDADTIWVNVNCGFNLWIKQKLRLRGIDAPDISTKLGLKAWRFVKERLSKVDFIVINTHKSDKYDRYLADIFYLAGEKNPEKVLEKGTYLNQELIDKGLAVKA